MVTKNRNNSDPLELEARVKKLETYWYVTLAVAGILGIGGGWITKHLSQLESESRALLSTVQKAKEVARGGPTNLDKNRGRDKWNSAGYAAAASG
jgi:hypothetical protein